MPIDSFPPPHPLGVGSRPLLLQENELLPGHQQRTEVTKLIISFTLYQPEQQVGSNADLRRVDHGGVRLSVHGMRIQNQLPPAPLSSASQIVPRDPPRPHGIPLGPRLLVVTDMLPFHSILEVETKPLKGDVTFLVTSYLVT